MQWHTYISGNGAPQFVLYDKLKPPTRYHSFVQLVEVLQALRSEETGKTDIKCLH